MKKFATRLILLELKGRSRVAEARKKVRNVLGSNSGNEQMGSVMNVLIVIISGAILLGIICVLFKGPISTGITNAINAMFGKFNSNLATTT